jgi:hypothetical protein
MGFNYGDFDDLEIEHPKRLLAFICVGLIVEVLFLANYY